MKNEEKLTFWKKLKYSIFDFDKYQELAAEKVVETIGYIAILLLVFTLVVAGIYIYKFSVTISDARNYIDENIETITFENYKVDIILYNHEKVTTIQNEEIGMNVIINTSLQNEEELSQAIEEFTSQGNGILILKDRILVNNELINKPITYSYKTLSEQYNINKIDKQELLNLLSFDTIKPLLVTIFGVLFIYFFAVMYLPSTLIDIIILSVFGYVVCSITRMRLKYSAVYNIAAYSVTLPIILNLIYFVVNVFTGFTIKYFEIMYTTVASIYIATAILMIRSDVIKKQVELIKIIEEQEKVRAELQRREEEQREQEEKERQKQDEEKKRKSKEKKESDEGNIGEEPQGNKA